jgi:hypothetical protein
VPDVKVYGDIVVEGLQDTIDSLSLFEKQRVNDFLTPAMRKAGALIVKTEKSLIPQVSGETRAGIHSKTAIEGIGWITTSVNPFKGGSKTSGFVLRFLDFGAKWSGRGDEVTTWRGIERARNGENIKSRRNSNPTSRNYFIAGLQEWAQRKIGLGEKESLQAAFAMRKSIIQKGLPGKKKIIETTIETTRGKVLEIIDQAVKTMLEDFFRRR